MAHHRKRYPRGLLASTSKRIGKHAVRLLLRREIGPEGAPRPHFWLVADVSMHPARGYPPISWSRHFGLTLADELVSALAEVLGYKVAGYRIDPELRHYWSMRLQKRFDSCIQLEYDHGVVVISRKGATRLLRALGDAAGWTITD